MSQKTFYRQFMYFNISLPVDASLKLLAALAFSVRHA